VIKEVIEAIGPQELSEEDRDFVNTVYDHLATFENDIQTYHNEAKACREVLRLRDEYQDPELNPDGTASTAAPALQLQTLKSTVNNCIADQMQNMPEAKLSPETPDQQQLSDDLQDAIRFIVYDTNEFETLHRRRVEDFFGTGTAVTQIVWDKTINFGKGDIALIRWPIESFIWDPKAEDIQDARALIKVSWHPLSWYKEHYPDKAPYIQGEDNAYNQVGIPTTQLALGQRDEARAMLLEYWYRTFKNGKYHINVAYLAGRALLEKRENVFSHGMYPFVMDVHSTIEGQPIGEGIVSELTPMMRYINKYAQYLDTNLRKSSKGKLLVRKNSGINKADLANYAVDMVEGDSVVEGQDWGWLRHEPLNNMIVQQMLNMQSDLKRDSGANEYSRGETSGGVTSAKAILALQEAGGKIAQLRTDVLNNGFKRMVEQILWLMAQFYDKERMLLVTGKDGNKRQVTIDRKNYFGVKTKTVPPPPYSVQIEIHKRNALRIEAMNEMFMSIYTMAAQAQQNFPISLLLRLLNFEGKDRVLPIIEDQEKQTDKMNELVAQLQSMAEQMAQMQKENDALKQIQTQSVNELAKQGRSSTANRGREIVAGTNGASGGGASAGSNPNGGMAVAR
jgi:hypothetical protein